MILKEFQSYRRYRYEEGEYILDEMVGVNAAVRIIDSEKKLEVE